MSQRGITALHKAAQRGQTGCVQALLSHGADVMAKQKDFYEAARARDRVQAATFQGRQSELLAEEGKDVSVESGGPCGVVGCG